MREIISSDKTPGWDFYINTSRDVRVKPDFKKTMEEKKRMVAFLIRTLENIYSVYNTQTVFGDATPITAALQVGRVHTRQCSSSLEQKTSRKPK